jgi:hypothetical protein
MRTPSLTYAPVIDHRPVVGSGSCARCRGSLDLASLCVNGTWYCSSGCAEGRVNVDPPAPAVPAPWLYARPRRFFAARKPKELKSASGG